MAINGLNISLQNIDQSITSIVTCSNLSITLDQLIECYNITVDYSNKQHITLDDSCPLITKQVVNYLNLTSTKTKFGVYNSRKKLCSIPCLRSWYKHVINTISKGQSLLTLCADNLDIVRTISTVMPHDQHRRKTPSTNMQILLRCLFIGMLSNIVKLNKETRFISKELFNMTIPDQYINLQTFESLILAKNINN